jgi:hypothetical protein
VTGPAGDIFTIMAFGGVVLMAATDLAAIVSVAFRYRRARTAERAQLKWLVYAGALIVVALLAEALAEQIIGPGTATGNLQNAVLSGAVALVAVDSVRDDLASVVHQALDPPTYRCGSANTTEAGFIDVAANQSRPSWARHHSSSRSKIGTMSQHRSHLLRGTVAPRFVWEQLQHIEFADIAAPQSTFFDVPARRPV